VHPRVGLNRDDVRSGVPQLKRRDAGSCSDVGRQNSAFSDEARDERLWVARAVSVVLIGGRAE